MWMMTWAHGKHYPPAPTQLVDVVLHAPVDARLSHKVMPDLRSDDLVDAPAARWCRGR